MTLDSSTNHLYLSDKLPVQYPAFWQLFDQALRSSNTDYSFLPGTNDVWAVDYMPIQVEINRFIRFTYTPDYLMNKKHLKTITDTDAVCRSIGIKTEKSEIIIDGGNVIKGDGYVIMTDKIFKENANYTHNELISELEALFQSRIIIIPVEKDDWIGHADGVVRYYQGNTVLVNRYTGKDKAYGKSLLNSLKNSGLKYIEIPYKPGCQNDIDASGFYINFLEIKNIIFLPVFNIDIDEEAVSIFQELYRDKKVIPVVSNDIALDGGVLNCISWNILT